MSNPIFKILYWFFCATLILIVYYRSQQIPPTQDEVISFFEFALGDYKNNIDFKSANNHPLNTVLGRISVECFGPTLDSFRLPNVFSFALYCVFIYKIGKKLRRNHSIYLTPILLLNPIILDYFSLARGYGMSFAFLLASIYYILIYVQARSLKSLALLTVFTLLATYSHLTLTLYSTIVFFYVLLNILLFKSAKHKFSDTFLRALIMSIYGIGQIAAIYIIFSLKSSNELYFGQKEGFYDTTIKSLVNLMGHGANSWYFLIPLLILFFLVLKDLKTTIAQFKLNVLFIGEYVVCGILILNCLAIVLSAELFSINYPYERVAIYLIVLFSVVTFLLIDRIAIHQRRSSLLNLISLSFLIFILISFARKADLEKSVVEPYTYLKEEDFLKAIDFLKNQPIIAFGDERLSYAIRYYNFKHSQDLKLISDVNCKDLAPIEFRGFTLNSTTDSLIPSNCYNHEKDLLFEEVRDTLSNTEYLTLFRDTLPIRRGFLKANIALNADVLCKAALVVTFTDPTTQIETKIASYRIDRLLKKTSDITSFYIPIELDDSSLIHVYLLNIRKKRIRVHSFAIHQICSNTYCNEDL